MRPAHRAALSLALFGLLLRTTGAAQQPQAPDSGAAGAPRISIITFGAGPLPYELFGHNMIRVVDPANRTDSAYNFGIFDWKQKNFYWNFIQGRPMYVLDAWDAAGSVEFYQRMGRSIEVQDLALTPAQARRLADNLARNAEPDQRTYRYDYYRDNCSTRVRDALNLVLGGALERDLSHLPTHTTYRSATAELTAGRPALYFGLMLLLGPGADEALSAWEESFIPAALARHLDAVTIGSSIETESPLVVGKKLLPARDGEGGAPGEPGALVRWFVVGGVLLGGVLAWAGGRVGAGRRRAFVVLGGLWSLVSGLAGFVMVYLWAFTDHVVAYRNENLLQASILGLALFWALAAWARRKDAPPSRAIVVLSAVIAALSVVGVALKFVPGPAQVNWVVLALFVPANLGMALGAIRAATVTTAPTEGLPSRP